MSDADGVVNVIRWTELWHAHPDHQRGGGSTVVISGVKEWLVEDGEVVQAAR
ncbi:MAG: hypothetical protein M5U19_13435 [Microthrixaceae bacterium]|nr:hypothetical protein [Microthrixaceae bacterium]